MDKIILKNEEETRVFGRLIGEMLFKNAVVCLNGDLGAGKTTLTKSIAKALNINDDITSPTFNIVNEYDEGDLKLFHFDVYRIGCSEEMYDIGYEEYIYGDGVCIIEWSNLIEDILPDERLEIELSYDEEGRSAVVCAYGKKHKEILEKIQKIDFEKSR